MTSSSRMDGAVRETLDRAAGLLLEQFGEKRRWEGRLSSSALATATATFALHQVDPAGNERLISAGLRWLTADQNEDGGWGDSPSSASNIATTLLAWSALSISKDLSASPAAEGAARWVEREAGGPSGESIARAVARRYGEDRTFAAPILTMCALAGRLGPEPQAWRYVPALPFELSVLPARFFGRLGLPVVSYALPALIALGLVRFRRARTRCPVTRLLRSGAAGRALRVLERLQPEGGGFLEATPLTAFVVMSLVASDRREHPVVKRGAEFLVRSARPDGSWPIDTNLATWVTTLSVNALAACPDSERVLPAPVRGEVLECLLGQQHRRRHPYTRAEPGGWAWTHLPGGVPDADDTAGALLALRRLGSRDPRILAAAERGLRWLANLQNRDGGIPTFCRGWGKLPYDRSSPDLTAHALMAWSAWRDVTPPRPRRAIRAAMGRAMTYLAGAQRADGAFLPLWFGNEDAPGQRNPTYGTARATIALCSEALSGAPDAREMLAGGVGWLRSAQGVDGGWGGDAGVSPGIEETAVATDALARASAAGVAEAEPAAERGTAWLVEATDAGRRFPASPIGLYFASLWYSEKLYPIVFTVSALANVAASVMKRQSPAAGVPAGV